MLCQALTYKGSSKQMQQSCERLMKLGANECQDFSRNEFAERNAESGSIKTVLRGHVFMVHYSFALKPIPIPEAVKTSEAKAAVDKTR